MATTAPGRAVESTGRAAAGYAGNLEGATAGLRVTGP